MQRDIHKDGKRENEEFGVFITYTFPIIDLSEADHDLTYIVHVVHVVHCVINIVRTVFYIRVMLTTVIVFSGAIDDNLCVVHREGDQRIG